MMEYFGCLDKIYWIQFQIFDMKLIDDFVEILLGEKFDYFVIDVICELGVGI